MNILITGCTGFIGSNILKRLKNNNKVYIILRKKIKNAKFNDKNIKEIYYNNYSELLKKLKKLQVDLVIHTATHYSKSHNLDDLGNFSNSNILLGNIILENLKIMKAKKFINFSTVWEDYNGIQNNYFNLYSAYKKAFSIILNYYKKKQPQTKFYELMISDTFGSNDKRKKIINVLRENYKKNVTTKIISKNLFINLLNVEDVTDAVVLIIKKKIKPEKYLIKNPVNFNLNKIIKKFNESSYKKIKIRWVSNKLIKEKTLSYKVLKSWKPTKSNISDIIKTIKN
tara:strand:- start:1768 stop:2619 length:852 start_codon:yes stop_codon:yes gene_type:complete